MFVVLLAGHQYLPLDEHSLRLPKGKIIAIPEVGSLHHRYDSAGTGAGLLLGLDHDSAG
jgi:hypothetical protein